MGRAHKGYGKGQGKGKGRMLQTRARAEAGVGMVGHLQMSAQAQARLLWKALPLREQAEDQEATLCRLRDQEANLVAQAARHLTC